MVGRVDVKQIPGDPVAHKQGRQEVATGPGRVCHDRTGRHPTSIPFGSVADLLARRRRFTAGRAGSGTHSGRTGRMTA